MAKGNLLVISGPSGVGKGTICKELIKTEDNIRFSVSMTTRNPREGEQDTVDYYFTDKENFENLIANGGLLEHNCYCENYYGTPRKQVVDWLEGGTDVILEIDVNGAFQVKEAYEDAILIFILPPSTDELRNRIIGRGTEAADVVEARLKQAETEMAYADRYDYRVVNDDLDSAVKQVKEIINSNR